MTWATKSCTLLYKRTMTVHPRDGGRGVRHAGARPGAVAPTVGWLVYRWASTWHAGRSPRRRRGGAAGPPPAAGTQRALRHRGDRPSVDHPSAVGCAVGGHWYCGACVFCAPTGRGPTAAVGGGARRSNGAPSHAWRTPAGKEPAGGAPLFMPWPRPMPMGVSSPVAVPSRAPVQYMYCGAPARRCAARRGANNASATGLPHQAQVLVARGQEKTIAAKAALLALHKTQSRLSGRGRVHPALICDRRLPLTGIVGAVPARYRAHATPCQTREGGYGRRQPPSYSVSVSVWVVAGELDRSVYSHEARPCATPQAESTGTMPRYKVPLWLTHGGGRVSIAAPRPAATAASAGRWPTRPSHCPWCQRRFRRRLHYTTMALPRVAADRAADDHNEAKRRRHGMAQQAQATA